MNDRSPHSSWQSFVNNNNNNSRRPHQHKTQIPNSTRDVSVPPLPSILTGDWNITGNASWLLDFAIIGFPKCGTSTLLFHLLEHHDQIQSFPDERCDLSYNRQAILIRDLYQQVQNVTNLYNQQQQQQQIQQQPSSSSSLRSTNPIIPHPFSIRRGIKCPLDLEGTSLAIPNYQRYFPHTRYVVGLRHPVLWFESFYNFRIHNEFPMPPATTLIGNCGKGSFNVCTYRGNFHFFLANLGKTNMTSPQELALFAPKLQRLHTKIKQELLTQQAYPISQPLFLYDVSQLSDTDNDRALQFRTDLQTFLQLDRPIPPMIWYKPGIQHQDPQKMAAITARKINICHSNYTTVRTILQEQAMNASQWIRNYLLVAPTDSVVVSSPDYFRNTILQSWERDPCLDRIQQQ